MGTVHWYSSVPGYEKCQDIPCRCEPVDTMADDGEDNSVEVLKDQAF